MPGSRVEVHAVDAGQETERHEEHGDDRHRLHDLGHAIGRVHEIDFHQAVGHFAIALDEIQHRHRMVEAVAQVGSRLRHDVGHVGPHHGQHRLALGPLDAMERHQRAPRLVDVRQRVLGWTTERLFLEFLDMARQRLDQRELAIDHEIDQRIDEVVDAERAQPRSGGLQAIAHRLEDVRLMIVERDHVVLAEEDADLPALNSQSSYAGSFRTMKPCPS